MLDANVPSGIYDVCHCIVLLLRFFHFCRIGNREVLPRSIVWLSQKHHVCCCSAAAHGPRLDIIETASVTLGPMMLESMLYVQKSLASSWNTPDLVAMTS